MDESDKEKKIREVIAGRRDLLGILLIGLMFTFLLTSNLPREGKESVTPIPATPVTEKLSEATNESPEKETLKDLSQPILPPRIILYEPTNETYNMSMPPIKFRVYGPFLDTVLLSIDSENILIPHDGYIAEVEATKSFEMLNESFETETSLKNWSKPRSGFIVSIDSKSYNGKHSLRVTTHKTSCEWSWISRDISVISGARYKIVTHIKAENVKEVHIAIDAFDGIKWSRLVGVPSSIEGTFDWREFSAIVDIPPNVIKIRISLNAGWSLDETNPATSWFDDIEGM